MIQTGLDHLLGAHGYLAAPVQHGGEPPAELEVPAPFGPNLNTPMGIFPRAGWSPCLPLGGSHG
jgi:hypothetical protein